MHSELACGTPEIARCRPQVARKMELDDDGDRGRHLVDPAVLGMAHAYSKRPSNLVLSFKILGGVLFGIPYVPPFVELIYPHHRMIVREAWHVTLSTLDITIGERAWGFAYGRKEWGRRSGAGGAH